MKSKARERKIEKNRFEKRSALNLSNGSSDVLRIDGESVEEDDDDK